MIDPTLFCGVLRNSADVGADYFWNVNKAFALVFEFGSMVNRRVFGFLLLLRSGESPLFKGTNEGDQARTQMHTLKKFVCMDF
jgi:hypothetical protein